MKCPDCNGTLFPVAFNYGRCGSTGYHDAGVTLHCERCGNRFDPDEMPVTREVAA